MDKLNGEYKFNVDDIRSDFLKKYKHREFVIDKTGVKTVELLGVSFVADQNAIFGEINQQYVVRELEWYLSESLSVNDMTPPIPMIWKRVSGSRGLINSNYGYLAFSANNYTQYHNVLRTLKFDPDSRRAIMIYTRPTMHADYKRNGMNDFVCTNTVQYLIRNNKLNCVVQMRSNDAVFGYKNDLFWQQYVLTKLHRALLDTGQKEFKKLIIGDIFWQVGSLHIYERHFDLMDKYESK